MSPSWQRALGALPGLAGEGMTRLAPLTEKAFTQQVREILGAFGYLEYHTHNSRHSTPGFPDIVALRGRRGIVIELKIHPATQARGRPTLEQRMWLEAFAGVGFESYVVRPDTLDGLIEVLA